MAADGFVVVEGWAPEVQPGTRTVVSVEDRAAAEAAAAQAASAQATAAAAAATAQAAADVAVAAANQAGSGGPGGAALPPGGTPGQVLVKTGTADGAAQWQNPASSVLPFASVQVASGAEPRPSATFVLWIGGDTEPANIGPTDLWLREAGVGSLPPTAPVIVTTTLNTLTQGVAFSQQLAASGTNPKTYAVTAGALPAGLTLSSSGLLSGTPTGSGSYNFTVTATNSAGTDTQVFVGSVGTALVAPNITTIALGSLTQGVAFSQTIAASGSTPITWAVSAGTLPAGLSLNTSTGAITGTPTGSGAYSFSLQATNGAGVDVQAYSGTVAAASGTAPTITTTSLGALAQGTAFSQNLLATGSTPISWSVTVGALPSGLTLNPTTGQITGTPTASGAYSFTITATNSFGSDTQAFSGTVAASGGPNLTLFTTAPGGVAADDGTSPSSITLGNRFYTTRPSGISVKGARLWIPAGATGLILTGDLTLYAWTNDWQGSAVAAPNFGSPAQSKVFPADRTAGAWTPELLFDTPITLPAIAASAGTQDLLTIGYVIAGGRQVYTAWVPGNGDAIESAQNDDVFLADNGVNRGVFTPSAVTNSWFGIDLVYTVL